MKTALINNLHPYIGVGKYSFDLFERLYSQGRDVEMVYCDLQSRPLDYEHPGVKTIRFIKRQFPYKTLLTSHFYFPQRIPKGYDLYHVCSFYLYKVAKLRKPCIITHFDLAPRLYPTKYPWWYRISAARLLSYYKDAAKIIAIAPEAKEELIRSGIAPAEKIESIYIGYNEEVYKPMPMAEARAKLGLPQEDKIVIHVGTEDPRKNIPTLLKAMHRLQERLPGVTMIRLGPTNPAHAGLKAGLNLKEYQNIPERQMPLYYNAADLFVFPSIYEGGIAYPPMEAMACGIPTIITDALIVFKDGGIVVPSDDIEAIASSMHMVLTNPEKQRNLSQAALKEATRHTLTLAANKVYRVYEEVFEESKNRVGAIR